MRLRKFIGFEAKKVTNSPYIAVVLVFLVASGYLFQYGISQYKHIQEEKNNFLEFENTQVKRIVYISQIGFYGVRLLFVPSPLMAFFDGGPVPHFMTAFIDSSERIRFYQPLRGQNAFAKFTNLFMTFSGFILLFGSGLALLYGFSGQGDNEWIYFLEELTGSRKKLFSYQLISKTFILLIFCLVMAGLSIILFIINGVAVNLVRVFIIFLGVFIMLFCFLLGGLIAATLKSRFWGWASMVIAWFLLAFLIPVLLSHLTYKQSASTESPYKMEAVKQKAFMDYERRSLKESGKFDKSKYGDEKEIQMFFAFWKGGFKEVMAIEKKMIDEMKPHISFYKTVSALFPSTFFLSLNNEMSSQGFSNLVAFNEYTQEKKKEFIWFIAEISILAKKNETPPPPFIKGNENIYQGQSRLPDNFNFGLAVTIIWLIVLLGLYWLRFNRMLDRARDTERELSPDELKKDKNNVIFTSDKGLLPQLITKLRSQNIPFLSVPGPASLPGDVKVKNLFSLFGTAVPEVLKEIAGKYVFTLEPDQKGKFLSEITRSLTADVLIFDNFLAGLSDDIIYYFADVLNSIKKGRIVVYFTNSLLVSSVIADCGIKWTDEKIAF